MKILGIDTTGQTAGAALLDGDRLLAEFSLNYKLTHSQTILPMIAELLERTETAREDIGFIGTAVPAYRCGNRKGNCSRAWSACHSGSHIRCAGI